MQNHAGEFGGWLWETSSYNKTIATVAQSVDDMDGRGRACQEHTVERLCEEQEVDRSILSRCTTFDSQVHHW
jgi:hypothetical protein